MMDKHITTYAQYCSDCTGQVPNPREVWDYQQARIEGLQALIIVRDRKIQSMYKEMDHLQARIDQLQARIASLEVAYTTVGINKDKP